MIPEDLKKHLDKKKIELNFNKNPIKMDLFLSFLTVDLVRSNDHLGSNNGWTLLNNGSLCLIIHGAYIDNIEYLSEIEFGEKLDNSYNNYVNPFYLPSTVMTKEGFSFFIAYYKSDIDKFLKDKEGKIALLESRIIAEKKVLSEAILFCKNNRL